MAAERRNIDWESIEAQYRAGIRSLKDIGDEFGVSDAGILKRARKHGWARDLTAKIAAKAEAKVSAAVVSESVSDANSAKESAIVEANATVQANAILDQRRDVKRARGVVAKLFAELEAIMDGSDAIEDMAAILASGDDGAMQKALQKVVNLPTRVDVAKKLSEAMKVQIELERKVLRIKDDDAGDDEAKARRFGAGAAMGAAEAYARMLNGNG